jgi:hypothetical protein
VPFISYFFGIYIRMYHGDFDATDMLRGTGSLLALLHEPLISATSFSNWVLSAGKMAWNSAWTHSNENSKRQACSRKIKSPPETARPSASPYAAKNFNSGTFD